jgi:hypothetical protein
MRGRMRMLPKQVPLNGVYRSTWSIGVDLSRVI